jgi:ABC-type nitrate/sulfonate/bicarbonate transport system permease component
VTVLLTWVVVSATGMVEGAVLPGPVATFAALARLASEEDFWSALVATLESFATGLALSALLAVPLGVVLGRSARAWELVRVPIEAMRPVPPVVVLPLALLVLGGGLAFKVALVVQGAVWPLLVQTMYAVRAIDTVTFETARSFRLGRLRTLVHVNLPGAAPVVAPALRLAAATAFAVSIVSELVGGATGLGNLLAVAVSGNAVPRIFALTLVVGLVGLAIASVFTVLERQVLHWVPGRRW